MTSHLGGGISGDINAMPVDHIEGDICFSLQPSTRLRSFQPLIFIDSTDKRTLVIVWWCNVHPFPHANYSRHLSSYQQDNSSAAERSLDPLSNECWTWRVKDFQPCQKQQQQQASDYEVSTPLVTLVKKTTRKSIADCSMLV